MGDCDSNSDDNDKSKINRKPLDSGVVCSICLEEFQVGDVIARASTSVCRHRFHEECIVSWLVSRQEALCPCCRQPFVTVNTRSTQPFSETSSHAASSVAGVGEAEPLETVASVLEENEECSRSVTTE